MNAQLSEQHLYAVSVLWELLFFKFLLVLHCWIVSWLSGLEVSLRISKISRLLCGISGNEVNPGYSLNQKVVIHNAIR